MSGGDEALRLRRSYLFVPASEERKLAKASTLQPDAVILDLEDGVAAARKAGLTVTEDWSPSLAYFMLMLAPAE